MVHPRRTRRDSDIGVFINRSSNFSVGGTRPESDDRPPNPTKAPEYVLRTFTDQVLEGALVLPGLVQGDLLWGAALVLHDGECSLFTVHRSGNIVRFDADDLEAVNGAQATVSYLTAI